MKTTLVCLLVFALCISIQSAVAQNVAINENNIPAKSQKTTPGFDKMQVFPGSVHDYCILALFSEKKQKTECFLYNEAGKLLQRKKVYLLSGFNNISWDMSSYTAGIYYLASDNMKDSKIKVTKL